METKGSGKNFAYALGMSALTKYYDMMVRFFMPEVKIRRMLFDLLDPRKNDSILEFGHGDGRNIAGLVEAGVGAKVWGVDMDPAENDVAEEKLRKLGSDAVLALYDGKRIPFKNNSFDKVYSCLVFHHLESDVKEHIANELYRVLKPGGKIIIADWGRPANALLGIGFHVIQILNGYRTTRDNRRGMVPRLLEKCGFERVEERERVNFPLGTFSFHTAYRPG